MNFGKRIRRRVLRAAALAVLFMGISASGIVTEDISHAEELGLCTEDDMLLIGGPGHDVTLYYAYDEWGNRLDRVPVHGSFTPYAVLLPRKTLMYPEGDSESVVRIGDAAVIATYPAEQFELCILGEYYATIDRESGLLQFYDDQGTSLSGIVIPYEKGEKSKGRYWGDLFEFSEEWLLRIVQRSGDIWVWISREDGNARIENDPDLLAILNDEDSAVVTIGDFLVSIPHGDDSGQGKILTRTGMLVRDHVLDVIIEQGSSDSFLSYRMGRDSSVNTEKSTMFCTRNGQGYDVYGGPYLDYLGTIEKIPGLNDCRNGYLKGLSYPELEGAVCEGFVFDFDAQEYVPYARAGDEILIPGDTGIVRVPGIGSPYCITSAYYIAENDNETYVFRVGENRLFAHFDHYPALCVSPGSSGIAMDNVAAGEDGGTQGRTIYDNEGNPTFTSRSRTIQGFANGTWYMTRGIYRGVTDLYGNWIIRDSFVKE